MAYLHLLFELIRGKSDKPILTDNQILRAFFTDNQNNNNYFLQFRKAFPVYFEGDWTDNDRFKTFFRLLSSKFPAEEVSYSEEGPTMQEVICKLLEMERELKIDIISRKGKESLRVINFWRCLTQVGFKHVKRRNDNIFGFAKTFPINGPKVVILAQDPSPMMPSFGYAFHKCGVPSSRRILEFVRSEMILMEYEAEESGNFGDEDLFNVDETLFKEKLKNCDLQGWIDQDILLVNGSLTFGEKLKWQRVTQYIIEMLNENYENIAFLLVGFEAKYFKKFIDLKKHLVLDLYHPSWYDIHLPQYSYENTAVNEFEGITKRNIDWDFVRPFYNAAKFRFERTGEVIDWLNIFCNRNYKIERLSRFKKIYERLFPRGNGK